MRLAFHNQLANAVLPDVMSALLYHTTLLSGRLVKDGYIGLPCRHRINNTSEYSYVLFSTFLAVNSSFKAFAWVLDFILCRHCILQFLAVS